MNVEEGVSEEISLTLKNLFCTNNRQYKQTQAFVGYIIFIQLERRKLV